MPLDVATLDVLGVGGWVLEKHLNDILYGHLGMDGTRTDKIKILKDITLYRLD